MPEQTEIKLDAPTTSAVPEVDIRSDDEAGSESDSEDTIPELEDSSKYLYHFYYSNKNNYFL